MRARRGDFRFISALALAASVVVVPAQPVRAQGAVPLTACSAPASLVHFVRPLVRTARAFVAGRPLTIVAIGSSSTAGAGASSPAASYPSRLALELKERFPARTFTVINRGINGTEVGDMLARFEEIAAKDKPDLVIWQLGTNSLLRDRSLNEPAALIAIGLSRLKAIRADVIIINPQYAPRVLAKPEVEHMNKIIVAAANNGNVNMFDRFAVMRHWRVDQGMPFGQFLSPDELHMNDWSYACIAKLLSAAIAEAATRPALTATAR
jgi:acyl-CoA thioesterase I